MTRTIKSTRANINSLISSNPINKTHLMINIIIIHNKCNKDNKYITMMNRLFQLVNFFYFLNFQNFSK